MRFLISSFSFLTYLLTLTLILSCSDQVEDDGCGDDSFVYQEEAGCDGKIYPNPETSPYILPFPAGGQIDIGLSNCSASYHGPGQPDQYAYDFDFDEGTPFYASRAGEVVKVVEDMSSLGGGVGNYVIIKHDDESYAMYLHSPADGIDVDEGDVVDRGQRLGVVGRSGLAGYPHLHFIVVKDPTVWPYEGIPVTFNNVFPPVVVLESFKSYVACN